MDCNKEEAIRAKDIAEQKMQLKDFVGARKIALKAQKLYPDLENVTQMITVCDVHCSAEQKLYANEMDWYGILQIEPTAVEATIKKQYRKFALQLHPDKNRFPGAEAAFKLIGEAQRVLLDHQKRAMHDMKRRVPVAKPSVPRHPPQKNKVMNVGPQTNMRGGHTYFNPQHQQTRDSRSVPTQQGFNGIDPTFWTICIYCSVRFQYYRGMLNKNVPCQNCNRIFMATELKETAVPPTKPSQEEFPMKNDGSQGTFKADFGSKVNVSSVKLNTDTEKAGVQSNVGCEKQNGKKRRKPKSESSECDDSVDSLESEEEVEDDFVNDMKSFVSVGENPRRSSRKKQQVSYDESVSDDDDGLSVPSKRSKKGGSPHSSKERNVMGSKVNVASGIAVEETQKEVKSKLHSHHQENILNKSNRSDEERKNAKVGEDNSETNSEAHDNFKKDSTSKATLQEETFEYPDPEFSDFNVSEESFAVGQIWATYDTIDAMPRFYCLIRKVVSLEFKVRITWLEPDPDEEDENNWAQNDLPISCGKYKLGNSETYTGSQMFSHLVSFEKGGRRNAFKVYPKKGETWALFKNWDIKWYINADAHQSFEYEFVEIVSDYVEGEGVRVAALVKLKGFVSLFMKNGVEAYQVPCAELFRFSHRVPSSEMIGDEREGVPKGSYELDPACLPNKVDEISIQDLGMKFGGTQPPSKIPRSSPRLRRMEKSDGSAPTVDNFDANLSNPKHGSNIYSCRKDSLPVDLEESPSKSNSKDFTPKKRETRSSTRLHKDSKGPTDEEKLMGSSTSPNADATEIPKARFHDFSALKSQENFGRGQIWAVYSHEDALPKYYYQITRVDHKPRFKVRVTRLQGSSPLDDITVWEDTNMLVSCGTFKVPRSKDEYTDTAPFSHLVQAVPSTRGYLIIPNRGEIWALYKNWAAKFTTSDLESAEYDIVEVLEENDLEIEVSVLELVKDGVSIFRGQMINGSAVTRKIPRAELYRFSHRIPAFKLTEEHDSSMIGFWELDPLAMPVNFFV